MSTLYRVLRTVAAATLSITLAGAAFAGPSASIEQVRNGLATATSTPTPAWVSGNAGGSNSHYLESHSIAYRTVMDQLPTDGTVVELTLGYAVKRSGSYAIDYLTQYQRVLPHVLFKHKQPEVFDPLSGVTGVVSTVSTAPIPLPTRNLVVDPDGAGLEPSASQPSTSMATLPAAERAMTLYGGTLIDVSYVTEGDVNLATSSSETQIKVRFRATSPKAVLAWGGHIACRWDWGFNANGTPRSAGGISGSSYHMRLVGWTLGSLGNQDRSLSTDAVYPVPQCGITNLGSFCAGSSNTHTAPAGMESYRWTLFDNSSGASILGSDSSLSVVVSAGTGGSYGLLLTTGASGFTKQCQGTVTVLVPLVADAGPDQWVCASSPQVQLAGQAYGGSGRWSGGAGTFSPTTSALNAVYTPTASEITAGAVVLTLTCSSTTSTCPAGSDRVTVTFQRAPTANAGADFAVCANNPLAQLAGAVGGSSVGGMWSGGAGTFNPGASALNATYAPTPDEIAARSVTLTLTSTTSGGPCPQATDQVTLSIYRAATADADQDLTVCASSPQAQLAGTVGGGAASGAWSGGAGTFNPSASSLSAIYTATAAEIAAGGVTLTLTTNDPAGPCAAANDQVRITINPAATANAGADLTVCASSPQAQLAGVVGGGATSGAWSGGAGTFSPDAATLNAIYTPSAAEIAAGSVTLTLTSAATAGPCPQVSDRMTISIPPAATVNAGQDRVVCSSSPQLQLAGSVGGGATSGTWSGGGGTFSPSASALNASYTPSAAEIAAGNVTLTLTTNDPTGPCPALSDQMTVNISRAAATDAGLDQTVCASSPRVQLQGWVSGGVTSGNWSGGGGTFSPSASALNAIYTPSAAEIAAGSVTLMLTSVGSGGPCPQTSDQMTISIRPAPTVNAGPDQLTCATSGLSVQLAGAIGGSATSALWSGGWGTFSPAATSLNASYTPSAGEIAAGSVSLTLTTDDPAGPCAAVSDPMRITFDTPTVTVADRVVCSGITSASLCASAGHGVPPYVYRWSNGATGQCITVADTGSYTVTLTDAKGCQATGRGAFRQRECIGMLAHTSTTCGSFMDGTGDDFNQVSYVLKNNIITSIAPGVFFYYTKVTAPSPQFTVNLVQYKSNLAFPYCAVQQDQVALYNSDCTRLATGTETSPGQASVVVQGAAVGQVLIISVKYSLKVLVGTYMDETMGCHYGFRTEINGRVVDSDPDGLQIGAVKASADGVGSGGSDGADGSGDSSDRDIQRGPGSGGTGTAGGPAPTAGTGVNSAPGAVPPTNGSAEGSEGGTFDSSNLNRAVPNPFRDGMRMTYDVGSTDQVVSISVYDLAGRQVRALASGRQTPGRHAAAWDGRDEQGSRVRKGMYFIHMRIGDRARQVRVTFLQ